MHIIKERNEYTFQDESNWKVDYGYKGYAFAVKREDNSIVCNFPDGLRPEQKQLATYIAALPDVFDALKQAEKVLRHYTAGDPSAYIAQEKIHAVIFSLIKDVEKSKSI